MKKLYPVFFTLCFILTSLSSSSAETIYENYYFGTLAGNSGHGINDGVRSASRFYFPERAAVDAAGNIYVSDGFNNTIRKITPAGKVTTLAGNPGFRGSSDGTGSTALFYLPKGVALDSAGNVMVADADNNTIRKVTPQGVVTTLAGLAGQAGSADGTGSQARFYAPSGVARDNDGNFLVTDAGNQTIRKVTPAGVVTTIAGKAGVAGSADGPASDARFFDPHGVTVDAVGTIYVADTDNDTIRRISPDGIVSTLAGIVKKQGHKDGNGTSATFWFPDDVSVDAAGIVYVADSTNDLIRKITPDGTVSTLAGMADVSGSKDGVGTQAQFQLPAGLTVGPGGILYVADTWNNTVRRITIASATVVTLAGKAALVGGKDGTGSDAQFFNPEGICLDAQGNIYIADSQNATIRKVTPNAVVTTVAGKTSKRGAQDGVGMLARFSGPGAVAADGAGNLYVADSGNSTIRKIAPDQTVTTFAGLARMTGSADGVGSAARFFDPRGIVATSDGVVYVADSRNNTIRKITPDASVTTLAGLAGQKGSSDGIGSDARFYNPIGLAVDGAGNVYVADTYNDTIRKVTPDGVVTTVAGKAGLGGTSDGSTTVARFSSPYGVAVDTVGNLYVADTTNNTIRKITPAGMVTTLAGLSGNDYFGVGSADGIGSTARFTEPEGIAVDSAGTVYVADWYNDTIRFGYPAP